VHHVRGVLRHEGGGGVKTMGYLNKEKSPFCPGRPVPVNNFVGRADEINRFERLIRQTASGRNENIFLTGERGVGKSSLADFICYLAEKEYAFIKAHCYLGPASGLEEICRIIIQELIRQLPERRLIERATGILSKYVEKIDFTLLGLGVEIQFTRDREKLKDLRLDFLGLLHKLFYSLRGEKRGIFLVLDDLNGVTKIPEFALFIKSLVDSIAGQPGGFPLLILLVGVGERMQDLAANQPSVPRIFNVIELTSMDTNESSEFFTKTFASVACSVDEEALDLLVRYSGGLPMLMHELGDAVFWLNEDYHVDKEDALNGILFATESISRKYLHPDIYAMIRNNAYLPILRKMPSKARFKQREIFESLSQEEKVVFDDFLNKLGKLGVLKPEEGEYLFTNEFYRLYLQLEALRAGQEMN